MTEFFNINENIDNSTVRGTIFDIQKFSLHDGPGIRTTVFLKGCPLRCAWCHNPESQNFQPELSFSANKCIGCGACFEKCPNQCHSIDGDKHIIGRKKCTACKICTDNCPTSALEITGRSVSVSEIMPEILRDKPFYESSGGGLTVSGGEPAAQADFTHALLCEAKKEGLHTAVESSCYGKSDIYEKFAAKTDLFLVDFKLSNEVDHKKYTSVSNKTILENVDMLDSLGAKIILRCPTIPPANSNDEHFEAIAEIANTHKNIIQIDLLAWHALGQSKLERMGYQPQTKNFINVTKEQKQQWLDKLNSLCDIPINWL